MAVRADVVRILLPRGYESDQRLSTLIKDRSLRLTSPKGIVARSHGLDSILWP